MLGQDFRYAIRTLRKTPTFAAAAILTVALGIGANTAIFSVVNAVMLRPLPFADPERLVRVAEKNDKLNLPYFSASVANYLSWKEQTQTLERIGAVGYASFNLTGSGDPEQFAGAPITSSLFPLLGIQPVLGRAFREEEDQPGGTPVVMISAGLWKRRFGGDRALIGKPVTLNGVDYTVVGIAPPALAVLSPGDMWVPLKIDLARENRLNHVITAVGRIRRGVTLQQSQAEMDTIFSRVAQEHPEVKDWGIRLMTFSHWFVPDQLRVALFVLLGAVGFVLLIACANVASLLLSRAASRQKEIAVRTAMGASRARLLRQLLTESLVISALGGAAGILAAIWAVHLASAALPPNLLPLSDISVDGTVLMFAVVITLATAFLFGIAPAFHGSRTDLNLMLKQGGRSSSGGTRPFLRNFLAAGELGMATVLLIGASLLLQSLLRLQHVQLGFRAEGLITFQLSLPATKYQGDAMGWVFYKRMLEALAGVPGIRGAALSSGVPFGNGNYTTTPMGTVGKSVLPPDAALPIDWRIVSPSFFQVMGIPFLRGRNFDDHDGPTATPSVIVSQETARKLWGTDDPIGRLIHRRADAKDFVVIGLVGGVRNNTLSDDPPPVMYIPAATRLWPLMDVVVRTEGAPESALPGIRQKIRELDPELPVSTVRTMEQWVSNSAAQPRLNAVLISAFAFIALLIASIGIYGVLAYQVNQRTREIGLRMALGAQRIDVLRWVLKEGMLVALAGIAAGLVGAFALSDALASLLYGVEVRDPVTFLTVPIGLATVALAACLLPARRAARVDPMVALRYE